MDYLDGGDLFVVLSFCRRTQLCGGSCYKYIIEITRTYRIYLTYIFYDLKHFCSSSDNLREILAPKTKYIPIQRKNIKYSRDDEILT